MKLKSGISIIFYTIVISVIFFMVSIFLFIIFKFQIQGQILQVKKDLFYISQNASLALDKEALSYNEYIMDEVKMEKIVKELIYKNYGERVKVLYIEYNKNTNILKVEVELKVTSIIPIFNDTKIKIVEESKIKLMEVDS